MPAFLRDRLFTTWLALVAVTLLSATIGGADGLVKSTSGLLITAMVFVIAFAKVAAVMFTYMDVARAPLPLKLLSAGWLLVVFGVLMAVYGGLVPPGLVG